MSTQTTKTHLKNCFWQSNSATATDIESYAYRHQTSSWQNTATLGQCTGVVFNSWIFEVFRLGRIGQESIKFILPEFVSYLREIGVLCVESDWYFCTPVLMNLRIITFEVPRLSTLVFKNCVLVGIMLAQRRRRWPSISSGLGQCIVLSGVSGAGMEIITRITMQRRRRSAGIELAMGCDSGPALNRNLLVKTFFNLF